MTAREQIMPLFAVFAKDAISEWRTRYALSTILLFILTTVSMIIIAIAGESVNPGLKSGFLWIVMFFGAMTGLSKSFISEEERGTALFLRTSVHWAAVYWGKLAFNSLLSLVLNIFAVMIFALFVGVPDGTSFPAFASSILLGSIGLATASNITSAIIAKANTKNAVFPVVSFPILLPLAFCGIETTRSSFEGFGIGESQDLLLVMLCYSGAIAFISHILFHFVWNE